MYYDENNLHGYLLCQMKDYQAAVSAVEEFLPYIDNWATCDLLVPRVFQRHLPELYEKILHWLPSPHPYTDVYKRQGRRRSPSGTAPW